MKCFWCGTRNCNQRCLHENCPHCNVKECTGHCKETKEFVFVPKEPIITEKECGCVIHISSGHRVYTCIKSECRVERRRYFKK